MHLSTDRREAEWQSVRVRREDLAYLQAAADSANQSVAACLHRLIARDRSEKAIHEKLDELGAQLRATEQSMQQSVKDLGGRLSRIEARASPAPASVAAPPMVAPDGLLVEEYERYYLVAAFTCVHDLLVHFLPEAADTVESRTNKMLDWLYSGGRRVDRARR